MTAGGIYTLGSLHQIIQDNHRADLESWIVQETAGTPRCVSKAIGLAYALKRRNQICLAMPD